MTQELLALSQKDYLLAIRVVESEGIKSDSDSTTLLAILSNITAASVHHNPGMGPYRGTSLCLQVTVTLQASYFTYIPQLRRRRRPLKQDFPSLEYIPQLK